MRQERGAARGRTEVLELKLRYHRAEIIIRYIGLVLKYSRGGWRGSGVGLELKYLKAGADMTQS